MPPGRCLDAWEHRVADSTRCFKTIGSDFVSSSFLLPLVFRTSCWTSGLRTKAPTGCLGINMKLYERLLRHGGHIFKEEGCTHGTSAEFFGSSSILHFGDYLPLDVLLFPDFASQGVLGHGWSRTAGGTLCQTFVEASWPAIYKGILSRLRGTALAAELQATSSNGVSGEASKGAPRINPNNQSHQGVDAPEPSYFIKQDDEGEPSCEKTMRLEGRSNPGSQTLKIIAASLRVW